MSKLTLLMILCILAFASAQKVFLDPPPCSRPRNCRKDKRHYCAKYDDGTIKQVIGGSNCPPCGERVVGYFKGFCSELQTKSHI